MSGPSPDDRTLLPLLDGSSAPGRTPLMVLYRGPLTSCNYDCGYCPFAKAHDSPETLRVDRLALQRFTDWALTQTEHTLTVLFTPWGEALTRSWYRDAMVRLSHAEHVEKVAVQTNAAVRMGWTEAADLTSLALWTTYHPEEVSHESFLATALDLHTRGVRFSVGTVGLPQHLPAARAMREALPPEIYLWVNAAEGHSYSDAEAEPWRRLDPLFEVSRQPHPSAGRPCSTGLDAVTVDGDGTVRRCHFLDQTIGLGNLYDGSYRTALRPRTCPAQVCDCHIGYLHLDHLGLRDVFAGGWAERIPRTPGARVRP